VLDFECGNGTIRLKKPMIRDKRSDIMWKASARRARELV
jgi:hypothetical protein